MKRSGYDWAELDGFTFPETTAGKISEHHESLAYWNLYLTDKHLILHKFCNKKIS